MAEADPATPARRLARPDREGERGQSQVELVAAVPFMLLAILLVLQLLGMLHAQSSVDGAAQAGAIAVVGGRDPERAVLEALADWPRRRVDVDVEGGRVRVEARPAVLLPGLSGLLSVSSSAYARPPR